MSPMILQANWGRQDVLYPSPVGLFNARNREGLKSDWTLAAHRGRQICARRLSPLPVSKPHQGRLPIRSARRPLVADAPTPLPEESIMPINPKTLMLAAKAAVLVYKMYKKLSK